MKTAISIPDAEFERFERVAARNGMHRSEFYRVAARRLADALEGEAELTRLADSVLERAGRSIDTDPFTAESERLLKEETDW